MTQGACSINTTEAADVRQKRYDNRGNRVLLAEFPADARTCLDVGCGSGSNARILRQRGVEVDGITLSTGECEDAASSLRRCYVHDLETGLPDGLADSYDVILCSHVLEHLRWPERVLMALRPLLAPGRGQILAAVPNVLFYKNRARLMMGHFEYEKHGIMDASHFRWFTFVSARKLFERCGFRVVRHFGEGGAPLSLARMILPEPIVKAIDTQACQVVPGMFSNQILMVAEIDQ